MNPPFSSSFSTTLPPPLLPASSLPPSSLDPLKRTHILLINPTSPLALTLISHILHSTSDLLTTISFYPSPSHNGPTPSHSRLLQLSQPTPTYTTLTTALTDASTHFSLPPSCVLILPLYPIESPIAAFEHLPPETTQKTWRTHVIDIITILSACNTVFTKSDGRGKLIVVSSIFGRVSCPGLSYLSGCYWALETLIEAFSAESPPSSGPEACIVSLSPGMAGEFESNEGIGMGGVGVGDVYRATGSPVRHAGRVGEWVRAAAVSGMSGAERMAGTGDRGGKVEGNGGIGVKGTEKNGKEGTRKKVARLLWEMCHCEGSLPVRLVLGGVGVEMVRDRARGVLEEMEEWKELGGGEGEGAGGKGMEEVESGEDGKLHGIVPDMRN